MDEKQLLWKRKQISILYDKIIDGILSVLTEEEAGSKNHKTLLAREAVLNKMSLLVGEQLKHLCLRGKAIHNLEELDEWLREEGGRYYNPYASEEK